MKKINKTIGWLLNNEINRLYYICNDGSREPKEKWIVELYNYIATNPLARIAILYRGGNPLERKTLRRFFNSHPLLIQTRFHAFAQIWIDSYCSNVGSNGAKRWLMSLVNACKTLVTGTSLARDIEELLNEKWSDTETHSKVYALLISFSGKRELKIHNLIQTFGADIRPHVDVLLPAIARALLPELLKHDKIGAAVGLSMAAGLHGPNPKDQADIDASSQVTTFDITIPEHHYSIHINIWNTRATAYADDIMAKVCSSVIETVKYQVSKHHRFSGRSMVMFQKEGIYVDNLVCNWTCNVITGPK